MSLWSSMTWKEIQEEQERNPVVILPIGCVETQGPYTPVGLEYVLAERLAVHVAERIQGLALPCVPYGNSDTFQNFPGTIYVRPEVLVGLYEDVLLSIVRSGFSRVLCLVMHAPNQPLIERAAQSVRQETGVAVVWINPGALAGAMVEEFFPNQPDVRGHGAEPGSSLAQYLFDRPVPATASWHGPPSTYAGLDVAGAALRVKGVPVGYPVLWEDLYPESGGFGNPTVGSKEIGRRMFDRLVDMAVEVAERLP